MSGNGRLRKWSSSEKLRIVLAGMQPDVLISELCRREGVNPTAYYGWENWLQSSAGNIFESRPGRRPAAEEMLHDAKTTQGQVAENLRIRLSAAMIDWKTPALTYSSGVTTVGFARAIACPSRVQEQFLQGLPGVLDEEEVVEYRRH